MADVYVLCGQSGVGKSTVASRVAESNPHLTVVSFGEKIFELARGEGLVDAITQLELLTPEDVSRLQIKATQQVSRLPGKVLVEMHLTVKTPAGFIAGIPKRIMNLLKPRRIVLLEADPYEVLRRRITGKEGKSEAESLKDIQEHAYFDRAAAISIAIDIGTPIKILKNTDVEQTVQQILTLLEQDKAIGRRT